MPILALSYLAFVALGLPDGLPGAVWPLLGRGYALPTSTLALWLGAGCAGYVASGLLAGGLIARFGAGGVLAGSVALTALAALGQASGPPWAGFLALALLSGLGSGAVDTAMNLVVARRFGPRELNWLHACWAVGATAGPLLLGALLAAGAGWSAAFGAIGFALAALAAAFVGTRGRWQSEADDTPASALGTRRDALRDRRVRLGIAVFWLYVGVEATAGQWAASVLVGRGWDASTASLGTAAFWGALLFGRVGSGAIARHVAPERLVRGGAMLAVLGAGLLTTGVADAFALPLIGAALAPLYPTLMAMTPARTGTDAPHAIGFQVAAAMAGGVMLPAAAGLIADRYGTGAVPPFVLGGAVLLLALAWAVSPRSGPRASPSP